MWLKGSCKNQQAAVCEHEPTDYERVTETELARATGKMALEDFSTKSQKLKKRKTVFHMPKHWSKVNYVSP